MSRLPAADADLARAPIAILGVPIDNIGTAEALAAIERMILSRRPHYFVTANVDHLVQAQQDVELHRILLDADLVLCDGAPLLWASRLLGDPLPERVAGSDLVPLLLRLAAARGFRVYFLGATPESAAQAVAEAGRRYPGLIIAGRYSPPFGELLNLDHVEITNRVRQARPDLLLVAFGCPKQEKWIAMHYRALGVPVSAGIGATIDFLSGHARRAPPWARRAGLEWAFRLMYEPQRLFRRYWRDARVFGARLLLQYCCLGPCASGHCDEPGARFDDSPDWHCIRLPRRLDRMAVRGDPLLAPERLADGRDCLLDLSATPMVDSTGIGFLIRLRRAIRVSGRELVLLAPGPRLRRALALLRLDTLFSAAPDLAAAKALLGGRSSEDPSGFNSCTPAPGSLAWLGEITAANAGSARQRIETQIAAAAAPGGTLTIDISGLHYIDLSGLEIIRRAQQMAHRLGVRLVFTGPQPAVRNVARLAGREGLLLAEPDQTLPRLVFLSPHDPRDPRRWSGTPHFIFAALRQRDPEIRFVSGSAIELAGRAARKLLGLLGSPVDIRFSKPFARLAGMWATARLATIDADAIVAVAASNYAPFLWTRKSLIYVSDTTFAAIAPLYPEFRRFPAWLRRHASDLERRSLRRAKSVIYPSEWAKRSAVADYGIDAGIIHVLPFGANLPRHLVDRFRTRKTADFADAVRLLYVSVDWERKNGDLALETVGLLRQAGLRCEIFLVGRVPPRIKASDGIHIVGLLDKSEPSDLVRLCELYQAAHFLILPTTADASPIVFSEAQAFGCPVITYDVGGIASAVLDGETGIVLPPSCTAADFAGAIAGLVQAPAAYEAMSAQARRRYEQSANWDVWAAAIRRLASSTG